MGNNRPGKPGQIFTWNEDFVGYSDWDWIILCEDPKDPGSWIIRPRGGYRVCSASKLNVSMHSVLTEAIYSANELIKEIREFEESDNEPPRLGNKNPDEIARVL